MTCSLVAVRPGLELGADGGVSIARRRRHKRLVRVIRNRDVHAGPPRSQSRASACFAGDGLLQLFARREVQGCVAVEEASVAVGDVFE